MARHSHRRPAKKDETPTPDSPGGLDIGLAEDPLPGGINHLNNHPVAGHKPLLRVEPPYYSGDMAHGVYTIPEEHGDPKVYVDGGRIAPNSEEQRKIQATKSAPIPEAKQNLPPVLVKVVPDDSPGHSLLTLFTNRVGVGQTDAVELCMRDPHRTNVYLLNEDTSNPVRFSTEFTQVSVGNGSVLPSSMTSYLKLKCQDRIYAIAPTGSNPVYISVILETVIDAAVP